eukprot:4454319-Pyramimonas_sp.AAC.1
MAYSRSSRSPPTTPYRLSVPPLPPFYHSSILLTPLSFSGGEGGRTTATTRASFGSRHSPERDLARDVLDFDHAEGVVPRVGHPSNPLPPLIPRSSNPARDQERRRRR